MKQHENVSPFCCHKQPLFVLLRCICSASCSAHHSAGIFLSDLAGHWIINIYILALSALLLIGGRLGDIFLDKKSSLQTA